MDFELGETCMTGAQTEPLKWISTRSLILGAGCSPLQGSVDHVTAFTQEGKTRGIKGRCGRRMGLRAVTNSHTFHFSWNNFQALVVSGNGNSHPGLTRF